MPLKHFLIALQFFTRIPITGRLAAWVAYSPAMLRAASVYFPLVGTVVGAFAAGVLLSAVPLLPTHGVSVLLAATLATAASVWLTGGFHEDGLADTADALGGYVSREKALEIMKDSRIGSYGTLALVLVLLIKISLLALLLAHSPVLAALALLFAHTQSRVAPLLLMFSLPHVGDLASSKSKPLADAISPVQLATALLWPLLVLAATLCANPSPAWLLALGFVLLGAWRLGAWFKQRLGGFTGDTLGCSQQITELLVYASLVCWPQIAQITAPYLLALTQGSAL
jgi:adenosylcobinamide-GDP ribazoletransferase